MMGVPRPVPLAFAAAILAGLLVVAVLRLGEPEAAAPAAPLDARDRLAEYVARPDPSYAWEIRRDGEAGGASFTQIHLTSQSWMGHVWRHHLLVFWPEELDQGAGHALLFIDGGLWRPELDTPEHQADPPANASFFATAAHALGVPVAVLRHVPFQPLLGGRVEDDLISHTFDLFMAEGDSDWPLLLPMVKSAVRAMDAVEEAAIETRSLSIEGFTVTGGSKRGWTSWLVAVVDERVRAVAPTSIDVLNMERHLAHQEEVWGAFSLQIQDYIGRGLHERLDTPEGQALLSIVDPYRHRDRLTASKLIIVGTNDPYWPLDAANLYWEDLPDPKRLLYLPNTGHGANDPARTLPAILALIRHASGGAPLPQPTWAFDQTGERIRIQVASDRPPEAVRAWTATSADRDFRQAAWASAPCLEEGNGHTCEIVLPDQGFGAIFAEVEYPGEGGAPLRLSTQIRVGSR